MNQTILSNSELTHYGVLGMKWGVRRYQNKDGTLTERGKRHLETYKEKELTKIDKKYKRRKNSEDVKQFEIQSLMKMNLSDVTKEQRYVGQQYVKSTLLSIGGTGLAAITGIGFVDIPRTGNIKTRYRLRDY